jgi:hypothetical protein
VPDPDDQSYDARRQRVRRAYARRGRVPGNFYFVDCPYCGQQVPTKDAGFCPPHVQRANPAARCPGSRLWELEGHQGD